MPCSTITVPAEVVAVDELPGGPTGLAATIVGYATCSHVHRVIGLGLVVLLLLGAVGVDAGGAGGVLVDWVRSTMTEIVRLISDAGAAIQGLLGQLSGAAEAVATRV